MKDFLNKIDFDKIKTFCMEKKRYIGAIGLFIVFVLVLAFLAKPSAKKTGADSTESVGDIAETFEFEKNYTVDKDAKITELLGKYYTAYASDDLETLETVAYPMSDNEKSYIGVLSQYYEAIENTSYYSKVGLSEGSYFVSVYNEIKFYGVDTLAPTLDFFYIETDAEGNLYINNLYSIFNLSFAENAMDPDVYTVVQKYMQQADFAELQQDVQSKYSEALNADANLANMIQSTLDGAIKQWAATINMISDSTEASTEVQLPTDEAVDETTDDAAEVTDDTAEVTDNTAEDTDDATDESTSDDAETEETVAEDTTSTTWKVKTTDGVNIRGSASTEGTKLGRCDAGTEFTATGTDGDWTRIDYKGQTGYIKSEFLEKIN